MAVLTILVWSLTFVNTKALLESFSAMEINFVRFLIAYIVLWIMHPKCVKKLPWREEARLALMGVSGVAVYQILENCAIHYTNASNVAILVSMAPITTALFVRFFGNRNPLPVRFFIGCAIAVIGVVPVSLNGIHTLHFNPAGDFMALGALLCWSCYSLVVDRQMSSGRSQLFVVRRMFFWALIFMVPFLFFGLTETANTIMNASVVVNLSPSINATRFSSLINCFNLAFLGILASAICFVLWNKACAVLGTTRCTVGLYFLPVITALCAAFFLNERMTPVSVFGTILIIFGVFLAGKTDEMKPSTEN